MNVPIFGKYGASVRGHKTFILDGLSIVCIDIMPMASLSGGAANVEYINVKLKLYVMIICKLYAP